ncbi:MAG: orotate phosphoribosyltransferase [Pseudomonadota bacterium]
MQGYQRDLIDLCLRLDVLRFGTFTLKSGRQSPYFFNAGLFASGTALARLGEYYARSIEASGIAFDMLFGPAYKGIPLAAAVAIAYDRLYDRDIPYAYNRKEAKDHGEGGHIVGAALTGRVLIVDDVISAGTSARESAGWIEAAGAEIAGLAIALDRQERGAAERSAVAEVQHLVGAPVTSIITLADLIRYVADAPGMADVSAAMQSYRERYGAS